MFLLIPLLGSKKFLSTFETSCGLSQELSSSYKSFPESKHVSTALQVIQDSLASPRGSSCNNNGKYPGFGPSSFPGRFRSKDFEIHNSSIGKSSPTCNKSMASFLGSKSVDGLRLTQSLWSKSENLLRSTSHAYLEGSWALGLWFPLQHKEHINLLEMKAVHLALSHFRTTLHLKFVVLATDYTIVVAYLKNQGGTHCFNLYSLYREILLLCSELQIQLVVRHIPGHLNVLADTLSRSLAPVNTEWELLQVMFNALVFFGVVLIWICLLRH